MAVGGGGRIVGREGRTQEGQQLLERKKVLGCLGFYSGPNYVGVLRLPRVQGSDMFGCPF